MDDNLLERIKTFVEFWNEERERTDSFGLSELSARANNNRHFTPQEKEELMFFLDVVAKRHVDDNANPRWTSF